MKHEIAPCETPRNGGNAARFLELLQVIINLQ